MNTGDNAVLSEAQVNWSYLLPICLVATLGGLLFGYDTGVISGAIEPLTQRFGLDDFMKGWASGCVLIGCAAGVLLVGPLSDRFGRKRALVLSAVLFLISAVGTALPHDVRAFILFRILGGIGIGVASVATPMYIAEIAPARQRGRLVAANQIAIVSGIAATSFINYLIAGCGDQAWNVASGWRWMFGLGAVPSLAGERGSWGEVFSHRLRLPLALGIALAVLQQVTGINVFMYFGATLFKTMSQSTGVDAGLLQQIVINGAGVFFTLIAIASVDRWGRRPLMLVGSTGMGLSLIAMGAMAQFMDDPAAAGHRMLACIVFYIGCFGLSVGPVVWVILAEIYPTAVRGRALGLATFCLWLADYAVTQTFPLLDAKGSWLVATFHHAFPFYVYALFCGVLFWVMWKFVPETKGRSLEEIERSWSSDEDKR